MMGNQNPVGVFDSGVGGIGTLSALRRELPQEDFLYFGDTLHAPYGTKPREEVMACVINNDFRQNERYCPESYL